MNERDRIEHLNDAVEAMFSGAETAPTLDRATRELLNIGRGIKDLPREEFRNRLRSELKERAMATAPVMKMREGFHSITPYMIVRSAAEFIDFAAKAFGAEEKFRVPAPDGGIMHAEVQIGDSMIELSDGNEQYPPRPASIHLYVPDTDATYQRALAAGATSLDEPADQPYGERSASIVDPFRNHWYLATYAGSHYIPEGLRTVNSYLHPVGAEKLIDFLREAFGAEELEVYRAPSGGSILHAKVRIGDSILEMGEAHDKYPPMPTGLHLYVSDVDAVYASALKAGATSISAPANQPYGERGAGVIDPQGNSWFIATPL